MVSQTPHFMEIFLHIVVIVKEQISKETVYGEHRRDFREVPADRLDGISYNRFIIPQLQHDKHV